MGKLSIRNTPVEKFLLNYGLYASMLLIIMVFGRLNANYLTFNNILNVLEQSCYYMVCAIGVTFVLIIGEVDLSVGGVLAALTVLGGVIINKTQNIPLAIGIMFGSALLIGLFNGFNVVTLKFPSFIATISTSYIVRGVAAHYTSGNTVSGFPTALTKFAWQRVAGLPILLVIALIILAATVYVLNFTTYGRMVLASGANKTATRQMGINIKAIGISVYVISALCACLGAVMVLTRSGVARFSTLPVLQMQCIAAAVIGGTSLTGGKGSLLGTAFGVLLIAMITSGLNAMGVSAFWQEIFTGAIIIASTLLDSYKTRSNA